MALVGDAKRYSGSSDSVSARAMTEITVTTEQPGRYIVDVNVGDVATSHRVRVPAGLAEKIGGPGTSDEELVEGSFRYLLEREPNTSILRSFSLEQIGSYFPGWSEEMTHRLGP